jgi:hypothetical protein
MAVDEADHDRVLGGNAETLVERRHVATHRVAVHVDADPDVVAAARVQSPRHCVLDCARRSKPSRRDSPVMPRELEAQRSLEASADLLLRLARVEPGDVDAGDPNAVRDPLRGPG